MSNIDRNKASTEEFVKMLKASGLLLVGVVMGCLLLAHTVDADANQWYTLGLIVAVGIPAGIMFFTSALILIVKKALVLFNKEKSKV